MTPPNSEAGTAVLPEEVVEETTEQQVQPLTEKEKDKVADAISKSVDEKIFFCDESASVFF